MKRFLLSCVGASLGYILGAVAGYFLVEGLSSNTHDRSLEAAMTGAFVVGPLFAIVAFIAVFVKIGKARGDVGAP